MLKGKSFVGEKMVLVHSARSRNRANIMRGLVLAGVAGLTLASAQGVTITDPMSADSFNAIATKIGTYFGFAVAAGLAIFGVYLAVKAGWGYLKEFVRGK